MRRLVNLARVATSSGSCADRRSFGAVFAAAHARLHLAIQPVHARPRRSAIDTMIGFVDDGRDRHRRASISRVGAIGVCAAMACGWLMRARRACRSPLAIAGALALGGALGALNGALIVRSGVAQLHHHAGDDEHLLRRDDLPHPCAGLPRPAARASSPSARLRYFGYVSALLIVSVRRRRAASPSSTASRRSGARCSRPAPTRRAADLSGVPVSGAIFVICHMLSGALAGVAALMVVARTGAAIPVDGGPSRRRTGCCRRSSARCWAARCSPAAASRCSARCSARLLVTELTNGLLQFASASSGCRPVLGLILLAAVLTGPLRGALRRWRAGASALMQPSRVFCATDWFGPLAIIVAGLDRASAVFHPSFLSPLQHPGPAARVVGQRADRNVADGHHRHRPDEPRGRRDRRPCRDLFRGPACRSGACRPFSRLLLGLAIGAAARPRQRLR